MTKDETLKLALEALEEAWYHVGTFAPTEEAIDLYDKAKTALREALAHPEQEPVAWISTGPARMIHWTSDKPAYGDDWIPLYTTPTQREWVGLTKDEILEARWHNKSSYKFARVLEAKLKEKNT